jgi:hypothetical protein
MASGQRRVDSASARSGHASDVVGDQLGMSGSAEAAAECRRLKLSGADWSAEVRRVDDASNGAEQQWRGASR